MYRHTASSYVVENVSHLFTNYEEDGLLVYHLYHGYKS